MKASLTNLIIFLLTHDLVKDNVIYQYTDNNEVTFVKGETGHDANTLDDSDLKSIKVFVAGVRFVKRDNEFRLSMDSFTLLTHYLIWANSDLTVTVTFSKGSDEIITKDSNPSYDSIQVLLERPDFAGITFSLPGQNKSILIAK